jgi:hypothetical protein
MKKTLLIIALFISACATSTKFTENPNKSDNVNDIKSSLLFYQSAANGVADITLSIRPDNSFSLYMRIIPQPMSDDKESVINTSGKWSKQGDWLRLSFSEKKLNVRELFDQNYAGENQFKVIDERTVDINEKVDELKIWGVLCIKIKK